MSTVSTVTNMDTRTAQPSTSATSASPIEIDPSTAQKMLAEPGTILIDVREADEHARERIVGAKLIPLSALTAKEIAELGARRVVFHCKGGRRSLDAATRCASLGQRGIEIHSVVGGIEAWRSAGLGTELNTARPKMSVMQQTQLTIGAVVVAGTALGFLVNPWFLALPAFMGCGLIFAGATGTCGLASLISMAPWNRVSTCSAGTCSTGTCSTGSSR
jgi:rhodanese-related sulfurtransferase